MKSGFKWAFACTVLASSFATTALADVIPPSSGNGELVLFVRDLSDNSRIYARGLGVRMDDVLVQSAIPALGPPPAIGVPVSFNYTFSGVTADANLTNFLSAP